MLVRHIFKKIKLLRYMKSQSSIKNQISSLHNKLSGVSSMPGVYVMKDAGDKVIYVGKARNLKKRMASYFTRSGPSQLDMKTGVLVQKMMTNNILSCAWT